jgi:cell division septum initiation protein DivIVA
MTAIQSAKPADLDQADASEMEGEIREFVRRDVAPLRRNAEPESDLVTNNINSLIQRVTGNSIQEIDRLIGELKTVRDLLHSEGVRVQREISQYAHLSQSAMQSTKIIADNLAQWQSAEKVRGARG